MADDLPAFTTGFEWDVLISYRQADNKHGWVTRLDETLRSLLDEHARPKKGDSPWKYKIFRDNREIGGNEALGETIKAAAKSSAVLLIVMSQNYLATDSNWCETELALFQEALRQSPHKTGRIFIVRRTSVHERSWSDELKQFTGYTFWELTSNAGVEQPISFDFSATGRVATECQRLGNDVWSVLSRLRSAAPAPAIAKLPPVTGFRSLPSDAPTVFLAEVHDDLSLVRQAFYTYLEDAKIRVVPEKKQRYRFNPEAAKAEIPALLEQATLVVQLHESRPIPSEEEFGERIEPWLFEMAKAAGKLTGQTLLRWRKHGTQEADVADAAHRQFVFAGDVLAEDLELFKQNVVKRVRELTARQQVTPTGGGAKVVVTTKPDEAHKSVAGDLADEIDLEGPALSKLPLEATIMSHNVSLQVFAQELEARKAPPKALVVVHADGDETWVQARMQDCRKYQLSKRPNPPPCAVVVKPPDEQDHPQSVPGRFEVIRHDDKVGLHKFLAQIATGGTR